jgi:hypothetical protein
VSAPLTLQVYVNTGSGTPFHIPKFEERLKTDVLVIDGTTTLITEAT